jgi:hypothetical protein
MFRARARWVRCSPKTETPWPYTHFCVGARAAITAPVRGTEGGIALYSQGRRGIKLPRRQFLHRQQVQSRSRGARAWVIGAVAVVVMTALLAALAFLILGIAISMVAFLLIVVLGRPDRLDFPTAKKMTDGPQGR